MFHVGQSLRNTNPAAVALAPYLELWGAYTMIGGVIRIANDQVPASGLTGLRASKSKKYIKYVSHN